MLLLTYSYSDATAICGSSVNLTKAGYVPLTLSEATLLEHFPKGKLFLCPLTSLDQIKDLDPNIRDHKRILFQVDIDQPMWDHIVTHRWNYLAAVPRPTDNAAWKDATCVEPSGSPAERRWDKEWDLVTKAVITHNLSEGTLYFRSPTTPFSSLTDMIKSFL